MTLLGLMSASMGTRAEEGPVNYAFYDGNYQEIALNTQKTKFFLRARRIILITQKISICQNGCEAEIRGRLQSSFDLMVAGVNVAHVLTNDAENLMYRQAFSVIEKDGNRRIALNLDVLEKSQATIRYHRY